MKNHRTHITRFLIIVLMVLIGCHIGLTAGRPAVASSADNATPPLPTLRGEAAIEHLKQTGLYHSLSAAVTAARNQMTIDPTFTQHQKLEAADEFTTVPDRFGNSVAISGETVVVGAVGDDGAAGDNQGSAYVFARSGGVWSEQQKLEASDAAANDSFGSSVAISGKTVVVGAPFDDGSAGIDQGSAYVSGPVPFNFSGFFPPVDNPPAVNVVNAGRAIPVKFSLSGDKGLDIFAAGFPVSQQIACGDGVTASQFEQTVTAGESNLSYDAESDTYTYVWKTEDSWAGTCRQLILRLNDGSERVAFFKFR